MANNRLILRSLESPWNIPVPDLTKGSVLTHQELDNNFIYLKGEVINGVELIDDTIIMEKINGNNINIILDNNNLVDEYVFSSTTANAVSYVVNNDENGLIIDKNTNAVIKLITNDLTETYLFTKGKGEWGFLSGGIYVTENDFILVNTFSSGSTGDSLWETSVGIGSLTPKGSNNIASGDYSIAEGSSTAIGDYSHAEGNSAIAIGIASHAEGVGTTAIGTSSHAEGNNTIASGDYSHAEGIGTIASGEASHAEGQNTTASGINSHAEGEITTASGEASHAEGGSTTASGPYSHAEGQNTQAIGDSSHTEGNSTIASGDYSHAEGESTQALGGYSHAEGYETVASGFVAHAEGGGAQAIGEVSHAEGQGTVASGDFSHAEGFLTNANGFNSHAEGQSTVASGSMSHAEGQSTVASGDYSHAEGSFTESQGNTSHAEGQSTVASGDYSHAGGFGTISNSYGERVIGTYNTVDTVFNSTQFNSDDRVFTIGIGLEDENYNIIREDALITRKNGITILPSQTLQQYEDNSDGKIVVTKEVLENQLSGSTGGTGGELLKVDQGNGFGYILKDRNESEYVNIGLGAIDLSFSDEGDGPTFGASGEYSFASGYGTKSVDDYSHSEGYFTQAIGYASHAEGFGTTSSGIASHTEGTQTMASGDYSHTEGLNTQAIGVGSHAEGYKTQAIGDYSHAEGYGSAFGQDGPIALADGSHAEGFNTRAEGFSSHAQNTQTIAKGQSTHAGGVGTIANSQGETVIGMYNTVDIDFDPNDFEINDRVFTIGIGGSSGNKKDALITRKNGITILPSQTIQQYEDNVDGKIIVTKEVLEGKLSGSTGGTVPGNVTTKRYGLTLTNQSLGLGTSDLFDVDLNLFNSNLNAENVSVVSTMVFDNTSTMSSEITSSTSGFPPLGGVLVNIDITNGIITYGGLNSSRFRDPNYSSNFTNHIIKIIIEENTF